MTLLKITFIFNLFTVLISSYCLCLIAVDRYRSIVTPQQVPWTVREALYFMIFCWIGAIAVSSPLFITQRLRQIAIGNLTICGEVSPILVVVGVAGAGLE